MAIKRILIIGQTPPPYHGQGIMTKMLIESSLNNIIIYHIRLEFSKSLSEIGSLKIRKVIHLFNVLIKALVFKVRYWPQALYYMPSGPNFNPFVRDIVLLSILRLFYKKVIFHFRAAGISDYIKTSNKFWRMLGNFIYRRPEISIQLSKHNPSDGEYFHSKNTLIIPNGIEDRYIVYNDKLKNNNKVPVILYLGFLKESKGVLILLKAIKLLKDKKIKFKLLLVGNFDSLKFKNTVNLFIKENNLNDQVEIIGQRVGREKWDLYFNSDIFCFPTYYESESFGNVVLESMMFKLPVVGARWRGVQDLIKDNYTGFLINGRNPSDYAEKLKKLLISPDLRDKMGEIARERYLHEFTQSLFLNRIQKAFDMIS